MFVLARLQLRGCVIKYSRLFQPSNKPFSCEPFLFASLDKLLLCSSGIYFINPYNNSMLYLQLSNQARAEGVVLAALLYLSFVPQVLHLLSEPENTWGANFSVRKTFENTCNSVPLSVAYQDPKKKKMTFSNLNSPSFTFVLSFLYLGYLK